MVRSPIFILLFLLLIFSCQKPLNTVSVSSTKQVSPKKIQAQKFSTLADSFYGNNKLDSAFYYYLKSTVLFKEEGSDTYIAYNLIAMAHIQQTSGDYYSSEETLTEALPYINNELQYRMASNNLFGIAAQELMNYDDAIIYFTSILKTANDSISRVTAFNNIATVYMEQKKYGKAIALLKPILKSNVLDTLPYKKARIIDNLGFAYYKDNAIPKGLALMNQGLAIRKKINDSYGSIESYLHLADFYKDRDNQKSKENALQAYKVATKYQSIDERLEALELLMSYNLEKGVNNYATLFINLNDSIKKVRNNATNQFAKIKYDSREATLKNIKYKEQRTETLLQLETQKNQKYLLSFGLVVLLGGIGFLIHYFRNKSKRELLVASYNTETRISKQLHDELANDVFYAMTFAETQDLLNPIKKETLLDNLDKIYIRTRDFSKENSTIETGERFEHNLKQMLSNYKNDNVEVIIKNGNSIDWSKIENEKKIAIQRVLQELMVNMKKYSQANFVIIGFDSDQNNVIIDYSDNGVGFTEKLILKNGLQNAENRIQAVKGTLMFDSQINKGFKAKILLPK
ncbi:tetratricopeptide repeat-containing sensor histidine kinase [Flavobacterium sandaracinum]|uniref:Tetratricopeptide repeat-containing sensor histidine kinase n=1 Tax=Flavobacterium sandaracinum TaxID=2541733 RepID=A0A4R5CTQ2_9FLAO|nr:tetratricopeptide repeat-containing sensor histidine kinase [Flavobacterium sandaracinum]TDE01103.1 tetratricopeptide repeat-containing sensor histidine kinase [Flavobacterium sandaracinum]